MRFFFNSSPRAIFLNGKVVPVHLDSEETRLSPISSPTVSSYPEFNSVLFTPADNCYFMITDRQKFDLRVNSSCILLEFGCCVDATRNRPSGKYLSLHMVSSRNCAILVNFPNRVTRCGPAISFISRFGSFWMSTILTFLNI